MMEAASSSETSFSIYQIALCNIPEDGHLRLLIAGDIINCWREFVDNSFLIYRMFLSNVMVLWSGMMMPNWAENLGLLIWKCYRCLLSEWSRWSEICSTVIQIMVFCFVILCILVGGYQHFRGTGLKMEVLFSPRTLVTTYYNTIHGSWLVTIYYNMIHVSWCLKAANESLQRC
jgi:hypothetical protein